MPPGITANRHDEQETLERETVLLNTQASLDEVETLSEGRSLPVYCICRRGVDSRAAVDILTRKGFPSVTDVSGGLTEWARTVDREFPMY